ncbi:MAG: glycosyltransferase family 2 protein [Chloroflexi bacterium]|nr:MAG: glycosyltransferase family 2 protein [Chloroflexota bacterium]
MNPEHPKVSIGLPVFNGERYLAQAINSILAQTFTDFELIISDNGSTDQTEAICRAYAAKDGRIQYERHHENRGAAWNYNRVFALSRGQYFKWAAADDYLANTFLEKCVQILDSRPEVVLCFCWFDDVDEHSQRIQTRQAVTRAGLPQPHARFRDLALVRPVYTCEEVFGLIRRSVLVRTRLIDYFPDSDRTLLAELGLYGPFYEIPEVLFYHRLHNQSSVAERPSRHQRVVWFNPAAANRLVFPNWHQFWATWRVIWRVPLSLSERAKCHWHMVYWVWRSRKRLWHDLVWAWRWLSRRYLSAAASKSGMQDEYSEVVDAAN